MEEESTSFMGWSIIQLGFEDIEDSFKLTEEKENEMTTARPLMRETTTTSTTREYY